jgi:hypothetical protein
MSPATGQSVPPPGDGSMRRRWRLRGGCRPAERRAPAQKGSSAVAGTPSRCVIARPAVAVR